MKKSAAKTTAADSAAKPVAAKKATPAKKVAAAAPEKPLAPEKPAAPAKPAKAPAAKAPKAPAAKAAAKHAAAPAVKPTKAAPEAKAQPAVVATTIVAAIDVGFGNHLTLRGEGPGLSWDSGLALECVGDDRWSITLPETSRPIVCKLLLNDEVWCSGEDYTVLPGSQVVLSPTFAN